MPHPSTIAIRPASAVAGASSFSQEARAALFKGKQQRGDEGVPVLLDEPGFGLSAEDAGRVYAFVPPSASEPRAYLPLQIVCNYTAGNPLYKLPVTLRRILK